MIESIVAKNTRRIIEERGLKKVAIAERAGLSAQQFSAILNNRKLVKDTDIIAIANALCVTPNELFGLDTHQASGQ